MPYQIFIQRSAEKELDALPAHIRERIIRKLMMLEVDPRLPGSKNFKVKMHTDCVSGITGCYTLSRIKLG